MKLLNAVAAIALAVAPTAALAGNVPPLGPNDCAAAEGFVGTVGQPGECVTVEGGAAQEGATAGLPVLSSIPAGAIVVGGVVILGGVIIGVIAATDDDDPASGTTTTTTTTTN